MKPFQNPYVVGGLAVVALALVFRNAIAPVWGRLAHRATPAQTVAQLPVPAANPAISAPTAEVPAPKAVVHLQLETNIDLSQVGWKSNSAPHRDPFQITPATITNLVRLYPPASDLLSLTAVWRQTGSSLAVINGKIVADGDTLLALVHGKTPGEAEIKYSYKIQAIEGNGVWVEGPAGREQVEFRAVHSVNASPKADGKTGGTAMK